VTSTPARLAGRDIDAVVAHAHDRDDLERRQLRDERRRHPRLAAAADRADAIQRCAFGAGVNREGALQRFQQKRRQLGHGEQVGFGSHGVSQVMTLRYRTPTRDAP
jgi:hypothetical protein